MIARKSFGRLGNRTTARLATAMEAVLVLPDRSVACLLENISRRGCRVQSAEPPRIESTVMLRIDRIEALGTVAWVRGQSCGIIFEDPVAVNALERIRWAVEHAAAHEQSKLSSAAAVWR